MFSIPQETLDYWTKKGKPEASPTEVAYIEDYIRGKLPPPYVEFITTYGYVEFPHERDGFEYTLDYGSQVVKKASGISHVFDSYKVVLAHTNMTDPDGPEDEGIPAYPQKFLPIGSDPGQSDVLLELGEHAGRIWFWEFDEHRWGRPENDTLGFVAENMYDFINGLRPYNELL